MKPIFRSWFRKFKSRVERRLNTKPLGDSSRPAFSASNIVYDVSHRDHAIAPGGIGAIHLLVGQLGLAKAIDRHLHVLKIHLPYHESDHVLNIAYNHEAAMGLHFGYYNYCRPHQTLTENAKAKTTPAMAAGLEDHVWTLRELVEKSTHT